MFVVLNTWSIYFRGNNLLKWQASEEVTQRSVLNTIHELVDIVQVCGQLDLAQRV
jgi:hypothetical protein